MKHIVVTEHALGWISMAITQHAITVAALPWWARLYHWFSICPLCKQYREWRPK